MLIVKKSPICYDDTDTFERGISMNAENIIFGLDIGTRNVVGIVGEKRDDTFHVLAYSMVEHEERAMIDGQIHDIKKAANTIRKVKAQLEEELDIQLSKVCIAAAGRVLKTLITEVYLDFEEEITITKEHIQSLELKGIEQAQGNIKGHEEDQFFCVGYNVITYYLNRFEMENLESHKGSRIGLQLLTTFLPQIVVDSLYTAVSEADLQVEYLSLEPIAAINGAIPKNFRTLNLALVDIGAGTSDIAITKGGSVVAYGMIPKAGDELTEHLIHSYLIDFDTAESIKLALSKEEPITYTDILGMSHEVTTKSVLKLLRPIMDNITDAIATEMIKLNSGVSPNAVFCVGGGGQIPGFTQMLSKKLELAKERVVLKGINDILNVSFSTEKLSAPYMVTPIGICTTALEHHEENFIRVTFNEQPLKLFRARELTVMDAALKNGYNYTHLMPRKGKDLHYVLGGEKKKKRGQLGTPAEIRVNNELSHLHSVISEGDTIEVIKAVHGEEAKVTLSELVDTKIIITINGMEIPLETQVSVNGEKVEDTYEIKLNDCIEVEPIGDLCSLLGQLELPMGENYYVNGLPVQEDAIQLAHGDVLEYDYFSEPVSEDLTVKVTEAMNQCASNNDEVEELTIAEDTTTIEDEISTEEVAVTQETIESVEDSTVTEPEVLKEQHEEPSYNGFISFKVTVNNESILLLGKKDYIFVDIFEFYSFDLSKSKGRIRLLLNGKKAAYTDALRPGDQLEIYWE